MKNFPPHSDVSTYDTARQVFEDIPHLPQESKNTKSVPSSCTMKINADIAHLKCNNTTLSGCILLHVDVVGVPMIAQDSQELSPSVFLGSRKDPTVVVKGKVETSLDHWAWLGADCSPSSINNSRTCSPSTPLNPYDSIRSNSNMQSLRKLPRSSVRLNGSIRMNAGSARRMVKVPSLKNVDVKSKPPNSLENIAKNLPNVASPSKILRKNLLMKSPLAVLMRKASPAKCKTQAKPPNSGKHLFQFNFDFPNNTIVERKLTCLISLKVTLKVDAVKNLYIVQIPVKWIRAKAFALKRTPIANNDQVHVRKQTLQISVGRNLTFKYPSISSIFQMNNRKSFLQTHSESMASATSIQEQVDWGKPKASPKHDIYASGLINSQAGNAENQKEIDPLQIHRKRRLRIPMDWMDDINPEEYSIMHSSSPLQSNYNYTSSQLGHAVKFKTPIKDSHDKMLNIDNAESNIYLNDLHDTWHLPKNMKLA